MPCFLEYSHSEIGQKRIELSDGASIKIGRGTDSDTRIPDPSLSRTHCQVTLAGDKIKLEDLGSSAGTFLGSDKITSAELSSGQIFQAGNTSFRFVVESDLDAPTRMADTHQTHLAAIAAELDSAKTLDRFELKSRANATGRNLVYLAKDPESGKKRAIKILPTSSSSEEDEARFMRAMRMLQEVRNPNLVKLYRAGRKPGYCWVAMEWFEEGSIADKAEKHGINNCLDWKDVYRVAVCISRSLAVLEENSIVHRSIRPTNILYRKEDDLWVLSDLVVAKAEDSSDQKMVTQQTFLPSDLAYTAPERLLGRDSNEHSLESDIYSLGAVLTELLTGTPPYGRGGLREILPRLREPRNLVTRESQFGLNEMFADFVNKLTEPDPTLRVNSAKSLKSDIERVGMLCGMRAV